MEIIFFLPSREIIPEMVFTHTFLDGSFEETANFVRFQFSGFLSAINEWRVAIFLADTTYHVSMYCTTW